MEFSKYLEKNKEIGFVKSSFQSIAYIKGLPGAKPAEIIIFENGTKGYVLSLNQENVEVLLLTAKEIETGQKAARTDTFLSLGISDSILDTTINPLGEVINGKRFVAKEERKLDTNPPALNKRKNIDKPFETGVSRVDVIVPLGKGQRELVVGDRKIGKTDFLLQVMKKAAQDGLVVVYTAIAKRGADIKMAEEFASAQGIQKNCTIVASSASDPAGIIFLAPFAGMTIAEYFRDQGKDVLLVLDDMTAHAKYYREITLLARRFPGRSSYPGDIFYIHSRLLERAGAFQKGSITCLPVAELVMGDISGFIQTNLMAITDGHLLFDSEFHSQGRRPPINPFLSVTRVGHQTQTALYRDLGRIITSFLVELDNVRQFMHFGAELTENSKRTLIIGEQIETFFDQEKEETRPLSLSSFIIAKIWSGATISMDAKEFSGNTSSLIEKYKSDKEYAQKIDQLVSESSNFSDFVEKVKNHD